MDLLGIFIEFPLASFVIAALFAFGWWTRGIRPMLLAAICWTAYGAYEYAMKLRLLCTGECNIRLDLLLIYPILLIVTVFAIWRFIRR